MKTLVLALLVALLSAFAQIDTTFKLFNLLDTLKPIRLCEFPFTYAVDGSLQTVVRPLYTYDGIDVINPRRVLTPIIRAMNDPNANRELVKMQAVQETRQTNIVLGTTLSVGGLVMLCIGAVQASTYQKTLDDQRQKYYNVPAYTTVTTTKPVYVECSIWTGTPDPQTGVVATYTCATDPRIKSPNPGSGPYPVPCSATTLTSIVYTPEITRLLRLICLMGKA